MAKLAKKRKIIFSIILAIILLFVFVHALLRSPAIQSFLVNKATSFLSKELQTEVSIESVSLTNFFDLSLNEVYIKDRQGNLLFYIHRLVVDIERVSLSQKKVVLNNIELQYPYIGIRKYVNEDQLNLAFILDYFSSDEPQTDSSSQFEWRMRCNSFDIVDGRFLFNNQNHTPKVNALNPDNFDVSDFNFSVSEIHVFGDTLMFHINNLNFNELQGFHLKKLAAQVFVFPEHLYLNHFLVETQESKIDFNFNIAYEQFNDLFADSLLFKTKVNLDLKPSKIVVNELAYFMPVLAQSDDVLWLETQFRGNITNFRIKNLLLKYGESTLLQGNLSMNGLPNLDETFVNLSIDKFHTSALDIASINLPNQKSIRLPKELTNLGLITYQGTLTGFMNDFVAYGTLNTQLGSIFTDISLKTNFKTKNLRYNGEIVINDFKLGDYLKNEQLGTVSLRSQIKGQGITLETIEAELLANISKFEFKHYSYSNISISCQMIEKNLTTNINIDDPNLALQINGNTLFEEKNISNTYYGNLYNADFYALNLSDSDSTLGLNVRFEIDLNGNFPDKLNGNVNLNDITLTKQNKTIHLKTLALQATSDTLLNKDLQLICDYFNLNLKGKFDYKTLMPTLFNSIYHHLPSIKRRDTVNNQSIDSATWFKYDLVLLNTDQIVNLLGLNLDIHPKSRLEGDYYANKHVFNMKLNSHDLKNKKNHAKNLNIDLLTVNDQIRFALTSDKLSLSDSIWIENAKINVDLNKQNANYSIKWDNQDSIKRNSADIRGDINLNELPALRLTFEHSNIVINDSLWNIADGNWMFYDSSKIEARNLKIYNHNQYLIIDGIVSRNSSDELTITMDNFDVSNFDVITKKKKMDFDGFFTGEIKLANIYKSPYIAAKIGIKEFYYNQDKIGDLTLNSAWDNAKKAFKVGANILYKGNIATDSVLLVTGFFYPQKTEDNFDLNIRLKNFKLEVIKNYLASFSSNIKGSITGELNLDGSLKAPELTGLLRVVVRNFAIDYLNESYHFSNNIELTKSAINFNKIDIYDRYGNKALLDGKIQHNSFKNIRLDLRIEPDKFSCLNTNSYLNEQFYGNAFASGIININGPAKDISINVTANTEKGTKIFIPISSTEEVAVRNFVNFISKDTADKKIKIDKKLVDLSGLTLNFDLDVTQNAEVQIILDETAGDIIKAKGNANIKMEINPEGNFNMFGEYSISQGDYLFTLENVINKRFKIEEGSTITWNGDPYNANVDIKANYKLRTSLYDLRLETDTSKQRIPVECIIYMKNNLFSPDISFGIEFPTITDEFKKNQIMEVIEPKLNMHFLSLIVMNRFVDPNSEGDRNTNVVGTNTSELLSNQLSNWLSKISSDFDIGVNYRPGDDISSEEVNVALSTQLFNDRVIIDGNIGMEGSNSSSQTTTNQSTSNIVGDVNVEYKWTDEGKLRIKAFNRSNKYDLLNTNSPYTQGVGIVYRKEFNSFKELFKRKQKSEKEKTLVNP